MSHAVLIGGNGKIGSYLAPLLLQNGYRVTCVSRGGATLSHDATLWREIQQLRANREDSGFTRLLTTLKPDVVVDLVCLEPKDMDALVAALDGCTGHYLLCGSIWVHGPSTLVPTGEDENLNPITPYGEKKLAMTRTLIRRYEERGFPGTIVHPGQIFCPGQPFIGPQGNREPSVWQHLREGSPLTLPNQGLETLHPVHAADVAGVFYAAITHRDKALGEAFHAVGAQAVTLRGYAELVGNLYGRRAELRYLPAEEWAQGVSADAARLTLLHIAHSHVCSDEKAAERLGRRTTRTFAETLSECAV